MKLSPWKKHIKKWSQCKRCNLCEVRRNVVLGRGSLPCDALLVGEAPGVGEDVIGKPFVGPAGKLLDRIIERAWGGKRVRYAMTNLVACIPKYKVETSKKTEIREPDEECIEACAPRLQEMIDLAKPEDIVAVGGLAEKHLGDRSSVDIIHPAAILRMDVSQKGLAAHRCIVVLEDAIMPF